jgi:transcriptional repressor NrdR
MRCPSCGCTSDHVIDSREARDGQEIRRRRECDECQRRFTTRERLEEVMPKIVKRDERREEYERAKLEHGIQKACVKRPVSENAIQRLVDRIERRLGESGEAELSSEALGELVLGELVALDPLAAARFASVFRDFKTAADYDAFFASLDEEREPPDASTA